MGNDQSGENPYSPENAAASSLDCSKCIYFRSAAEALLKANKTGRFICTYNNDSGDLCNSTGNVVRRGIPILQTPRLIIEPEIDRCIQNKK